MVLVFTSSADNSNYVESEVHLALKRNIQIIPIQFGDVSPGGALEFLLANRHWIYAHMPPQENELDRLIDAVSNYLREESKISEKIKVNEQPEAPEEEIPEEVRSLESKAQKIDKNEKGFWEADYGDGIKMVYIPGGEFTMGSDDYDMEKPIHTVYLDGYWMGKYEVTIKQFVIFVGDESYITEAEKGGGAITWTCNKCEHKEGTTWRNSGFKQDDNHPVVCVSWNDVRAYCEWLSNKRGLSFKLPTEAQWEKAARGTDSRKYPWGNGEPDETLANFDGKIGKTSPVGSYPQGASPYGLLDMVGNVWEWCNDWYDGDFYKKSPKKNPPGPEKKNLRVVRGGCWSYNARDLRCALRGNVKHSNRYDYVGFRLCQDK